MSIKNFKKKVLKNGITLIMESRPLPLVAVSIANTFGAAFEESKIKGIAHVIEHVVFTGTKTRTHEDISREIEKKGGILNAFTSHDVTSFWFKLPSQHLFAGLDILSDILNNPLFEEKKFEKEKKVILEEIKMYHDDPQRNVFDKIEENLYQKPLGQGIAGSAETVSALQRNFVLDYFKKAYNPKNYIVTIVGKADFNKVAQYLEKKFQATSTKMPIQKITPINKETVEERAEIDQAHFVLAFHAPMLTQKEHDALEVLDAYIASGMSSKLFLKIREEKGLAYTVRGSLNTEKSYSYYSLYVGTTKVALPEVKKIILEEFEKVKTEMTEKDLQEAKERLIGLKQVTSEESVSTMQALLFTELTSKAEDYYAYEKKISAVKIADVKKISKIKSYSTAAIVPK